MRASDQRARADQFHRLHDGLLILPNAWDPPSARMVTAAGAPAVATTSAGVAWSRGVADGGGLDRRTAVDAAARVVAAVEVPVSVDVERGYDDVTATLAAVRDAGAVGVNIEDSRAGSLVPVAEQVELLGRAVAAAETGPVRLFVNARVDSFLLGRGEGGDPGADAIHRATAYASCGAHGIFVPGLSDPEVIRALVARIDVPLNVMVLARTGVSVRELAALGVRRISTGPQLAMSAYGEVRRWAEHILAGRFDDVPAGAAADDLQRPAYGNGDDPD